MKKVLLSWSSGKDSAWAFHLLSQQEEVQVAALLTTFNSAANRVAMHAVRRSLVEEQAERLKLPLWQIELPSHCTNAQYEALLQPVWERARLEGMSGVAFGDLFLRDIRDYRERQLRETGLEPLFPVWDLATCDLANEMIAAGVKAKVTCVDPRKLNRLFAGRDFDRSFVSDLPEGVDPCGENGEFHTFVYESPSFSRPMEVRNGEVVERNGFVFADVVSVDAAVEV